MGRNLTRWLIPLPAILFSIWPTTVRAEPIPGLNTTYYTIDEIPPVQSTSEYPVCGSEIENNINRNYDGELYENCTYDLFMVHMTGFIEIPEHNTIEFMLASDDGGTIKIGSDEWGNWYDQGCTWMMSGPLELDAGSQPLDLWMYEHGGSTCIMLAWNIDNAGFVIVPDEAFTTTASPTTTTVPPTTTIQETTTTWTTTTSSTTTTTTTTTTAPSTTVPVTTAPTTTTPQIISTLQPEPTMPEPPATVPLPQIEPPAMPEIPPLVLPEIETYPPETLNLPPDTYPTIEPPDTLPFVEEPTDDTTPTEVLPDEVTEETIPLEETPVEELNDEELLTALESIEEGVEVSEELAVAVAQSAEVVASLSPEEATAVFEAIEVDNLSEEEAQAIVEAVQDAPAEVREAFEEEINIFSPGFDNYVPLGSNIPVSTRRTLIAVAAGAAIAAAGTRRP